jgi:hypothetical protein
MALASFDYTLEGLASEGFEVDHRRGLHGRSAIEEQLIEIEAAKLS